MSKRRIKLIRMEDPYIPLKKGDKGTISGEKDGEFVVLWDNGETYNINPDLDEYVIEKSLISKFNEFNSINLEYIDSKLEEIEDLSDGYFDYVLSNDHIFCKFFINNKNIEWNINLKSIELEEIVDEKTTQYKFNSIDSIFYKIEKDIFKYLNISESFFI